MKTKVTAVVAGALATLISWVVAFAILTAIHRGSFPWLLTGLITFLCPVVGGYITARLEPINRTRLGVLSGFSAGLVVLLAAAIVSNLAPNTTLAGIALAAIGAVGGGAGALLAPKSAVRGGE